MSHRIPKASCEEILEQLATLFRAEAYEELLSQCEILLKVDRAPIDTFFILDMYQKALRVTDRLNEALRVAEKELAILVEHFSEHLLYKAQVLQNIALLHTQLKEYSDSIHNASQAIDIFRENSIYENYLAGALCIISSAHYHAGDLVSAEKELLEALAIWKKNNDDPCHFPVSTCYNNLGRIYETLGQHEKAITFHAKAVTLRKELLGDHQETAFSLGNIGTAYASMGEWHKASLALREAMEIYRKVDMLGSDIANSYQANLDVALQALNDKNA